MMRVVSQESCFIESIVVDGGVAKQVHLVIKVQPCRPGLRLVPSATRFCLDEKKPYHFCKVWRGLFVPPRILVLAGPPSMAASIWNKICPLGFLHLRLIKIWWLVPIRQTSQQQFMLTLKCFLLSWRSHHVIQGDKNRRTDVLFEPFLSTRNNSGGSSLSLIASLAGPSWCSFPLLRLKHVGDIQTFVVPIFILELPECRFTLSKSVHLFHCPSQRNQRTRSL